MAIISFSKDTLVDYVPEYGGNRQSDDPCVVRLRFVPFGEAREYSRLIAAKTVGATSQEKIMVISQALQKEQFVKHVDSVSNFSVDGKEVSDAEGFYLSAPGELIAEVLDAMQDSFRLSKGQLKNSERVSVGAS